MGLAPKSSARDGLLCYSITPEMLHHTRTRQWPGSRPCFLLKQEKKNTSAAAAAAAAAADNEAGGKQPQQQQAGSWKNGNGSVFLKSNRNSEGKSIEAQPP